MKSETVLKSLAELSPETFEAKKPERSKADSKPTSAELHQEPQTRSPFRAPDRSEFVGYRHWGLNE